MFVERQPGIWHLVLMVALVALSATADPLWPTEGSWSVITSGGGPFLDLQNDEAGDLAWSSPNPDQLDLVGGTDENGFLYPTAYWATDGANLMFRMRADNPYDPHSWVYTVLLNTDADDLADYILQWDDKTDDRVEMNGLTGSAGPSSSPPWGLNNTVQNASGTQVGIGPESIWARGLDATALDGSQFHQTTPADNDAFLDLGVPIWQFLQVTGLNPGDPFSVAFGTSASHITLGNDKPDGGWSDPISVVPEPGAGALLAVGAAAALLRRSRRKGPGAAG